MKLNRKKHVLVLGCGRSGTSIFGELFLDTGLYDYRSEVSMDEIMSMEIISPLALKVPRASEQFPCKDGLSFPIDSLLRKFNDDIQIFWIVRHPLDTICSLKVGISQNWGHHPRPDDWEEWLSRPLIEQCAHHWNYINSVSYMAVRNQAALVKFENMIADPERFAESVFEKIDSKAPNYVKWARRVQDRNNEAFIEAKTSRAYSRKDHSKRVGRWKENLSDKDIRAVIPIIEKTASELGYDLPNV